MKKLYILFLMLLCANVNAASYVMKINENRFRVFIYNGPPNPLVTPHLLGVSAINGVFLIEDNCEIGYSSFHAATDRGIVHFEIDHHTLVISLGRQHEHALQQMARYGVEPGPRIAPEDGLLPMPQAVPRTPAYWLH